jgi:hypothetical protein
MEAQIMKRAMLLIVAVLTVMAVDASIRSINESRAFTVVITEPENSLISYECGIEAKLRPGYWSAVKVAQLENRMQEEVIINYSQHLWIEGGEGIRFIGIDAPLSLQPLESQEVMGGFIVDEHSTNGKLYFVFSATWPNGSAVIKTGVCPLEVEVKHNSMSVWAFPEGHHKWDDESWGGYFYYDGGSLIVPIYSNRDTQIGWLQIMGGETTTICYNLTSSGYRIDKINLMVKVDEIQENNPDNYTYVVENVDRESFCIDIGEFSEGYIAAHAVVR